MSIKQLLQAGGSVKDVWTLFDPSINNFGPPDDKPELVTIKDSAGVKTGKYSKDTIKGLIKAAKATGVDPYEMVALSLQETGLGNTKGRRQGLGSESDYTEHQADEVMRLQEKTGLQEKYLRLGVILRDKLKYAEKLGFKDEASRLQAYNGYGKINKKTFGSDKAYGVDIPDEGIDMKKNPLYGKRLIQLKKDLETNKDISSLVKSL